MTDGFGYLGWEKVTPYKTDTEFFLIMYPNDRFNFI